MVADGKAHVEYPASDPYVTAVGGTSISNVSGTSFTEFTWPFSGGGISDFFRPPDFPLPPWQSFARVPASVNDGRNGRGVPDIAGNADGHSGYIIYLSGDPSFGAFGGTSASTPLYAALVALLNAGLGENLGYLNPMLYALPSFVFRDIADGQSNSYLGSPGYVSGPGWDACTGLGVVNGMAAEIRASRRHRRPFASDRQAGQTRLASVFCLVTKQRRGERGHAIPVMYRQRDWASR